MTGKQRLEAEFGEDVWATKRKDFWDVRLYPNNQPSILLGVGGTEEEAWEMSAKDNL